MIKKVYTYNVLISVYLLFNFEAVISRMGINVCEMCFSININFAFYTVFEQVKAIMCS